MSVAAVAKGADRPPIHEYVALLVAAMVGATLAVALVIAVHQADEMADGGRRAIVQDAVRTADTLGRDAAAIRLLLSSLADSPSLQAGDLAAFTRQLDQISEREGLRLRAWDRERRVPTAAGLPPRWADPGDAATRGHDILVADGTVTSERIYDADRRQWAVNIALFAGAPGADMRYVVSCPLPEARLTALMAAPMPLKGAGRAVVDRLGATIEASVAGAALPDELVAAVRERIESGRGQKEVFPVGDLVATLATAPGTTWTALAWAPAAALRTPFWRAARPLLFGALSLLMAGTAMAWFVSRRLEHPVRVISESARRLDTRYETFWNQAESCLFAVRAEADGRFAIEGVNPAYERLTGLRALDLAGRDPRECLPPGVAEAFIAHFSRCLEAGRPLRYEAELDLPVGRRRWKTTLVPVPEPDGSRSCLILGTATDVTAERQAEEAAEANHQLLQGTLDALPTGIAILDRSGTIVHANKAWRRLATDYGFAGAPCSLGANYLDACVGSGTADAGAVAHKLSGVLAGITRHFSRTYRLETLQSERSFLLRALRFERAGVVHVVVAHEDVTELTLARQTVDELGARLVALQENERRRIASELHDSTAQHLVAASLTLMHARALVGDNADALATLETVEASLHDAQREIRIFTYLLYPQTLETDGLRATLRTFIAGFSRRAGLAAHVVISQGVDGLPREIQRAVLRIVQEALANVHRHAEASRFSVHLRSNHRGLHLSVRDDGRGFQDEKRSIRADGPATGVGLPGMRTRVRQFGGKLHVLSGPGGTTLRAFIPRHLPERSDGAAGAEDAASGGPVRAQAAEA